MPYGLWVEPTAGRYIVTAVQRGSLPERTGVQPGDDLVSIDGVSGRDLSMRPERECLFYLEKMVSLTFASWNQVADWLRDVDALVTDGSCLNTGASYPPHLRRRAV